MDKLFLLCGLVRTDVSTHGSYKPKIVLEEHLVELCLFLYRGISQALVVAEVSVCYALYQAIEKIPFDKVSVQKMFLAPSKLPLTENYY